MYALHTLAAAVNDLAAAAPHMTIPNPDATRPPGTGGITMILGWLKWIGYAVVGGAILIGGAMIAVNFRQGNGADALPKILWPMAGAIVIGSGAGWIGAVAGS